MLLSAGTERDSDVLREVLLETNPYLLGKRTTQEGEGGGR